MNGPLLSHLTAIARLHENVARTAEKAGDGDAAQRAWKDACAAWSRAAVLMEAETALFGEQLSLTAQPAR